MTHSQQGTIFDVADRAPVHPHTARLGKHIGAHERYTRYKRVAVEQLDSTFEPTEQDTAILSALAERRALTAAQVKAIVFPLQRSDFQCNHRLKMLYHHRYVLRIFPRQTRLENKPFINILDHAGAHYLAARTRC